MTTTTTPDLVTRALAALADFGFATGRLGLQRLGGFVRIALPAGPAMEARLLAAALALRAAGLGCDVHPAQGALVAFPASVAPSGSRATPAAPPAPCTGCQRGRCVMHGSLFSELDA